MNHQKSDLNEPPSQVVLVDGRGIITDVQSQGRPAMRSSPGFGAWKVGDSYLAHCENDGQRSVIQALLDRKRSLVSLVVPPRLPQIKAWQVVVGVPIGSDVRAGVILMHIDITAWVQNKDASHDVAGDQKREKLSAALVQNTFSEALTKQFSVVAERVPSPNPDVESLSPRQREVLLLLAAGKNNLEIAEDLSCSLNTVKRHVTAVLQKLRLPNRTRAAMLATQLDLHPANVPRSRSS
jgi:DNA-binding CsgD family transcriptional regulator